MRTTTITIDYAHPRGYEIGYQGENNIVNLVLPVPSHIEGADGYRVYFESSAGEYLQTELLTPVDGCVTVTLTSDIIPAPGQIAAQLVAFADGDIIGKAPVIYGTALYAIPSGSTEQVSKSIEAEIALNSAARHTHANKSVLDLLSDDTGTLLYDGKTVTGASDLTIGMTVEGDGEKFKVTSCDATVEQIDDALVNGQRIAVVITGENAKFLLPMLQGTQGEAYYFGSFLLGQTAAAYVWKDTSSGISTWTFDMYQIEAESVDYSNAALPNISTVGGAIDALVKKSGHTHDNKSVLDLISAANGKLRYNALDINYAPTQYTYSTEQVSATLADNAEYRMTGLQTLTVQYPENAKFECWMRLSFAASGDITVTLPAGTGYIGTAPDFQNGETWELSFKDKILAAQKVGDGT